MCIRDRCVCVCVHVHTHTHITMVTFKSSVLTVVNGDNSVCVCVCVCVCIYLGVCVYTNTHKHITSIMFKSNFLTDANGTKSVYMVFHPLDSSHTKEVQGHITNTKYTCFIHLIPRMQRKFRDRQQTQRTGVSSTWFLTHKGSSATYTTKYRCFNHWFLTHKGSPGTHNKHKVQAGGHMILDSKRHLFLFCSHELSLTRVLHGTSRRWYRHRCIYYYMYSYRYIWTENYAHFPWRESQLKQNGTTRPNWFLMLVEDTAEEFCHSHLSSMIHRFLSQISEQSQKATTHIKICEQKPKVHFPISQEWDTTCNEIQMMWLNKI